MELNPRLPILGSVVFVNVGPIKHRGVLSRDPDGSPTVISNSRRAGGVAEESLDEFAGSRPVHHEGFLGNLSPEAVISRARLCLGQRWNLWSWNCDHFVTWAHGLTPRSPQLRGAVICCSLALVAVVAIPRTR